MARIASDGKAYPAFAVALGASACGSSAPAFCESINSPAAGLAITSGGIAVAALAAPVPFGHGQRSISYAEATFASSNTVDMLFTPSAGKPPHLGNASSFGHNSHFTLPRLVGSATVRAFIGAIRQAVPTLARAPFTSTTGHPAAVRRDDAGKQREAGTPTSSGVPIAAVSPSPTPTASPRARETPPRALFPVPAVLSKRAAVPTAVLESALLVTNVPAPTPVL